MTDLKTPPQDAPPGSLVVTALRSGLAGPFDLEIAPGQCAAITGASGSGKSLLLRMLADLDPNEGDVRLGATDRAATSAPAWRRQVVNIAAEAGWWGETVGEHFARPNIEPAKALAARLGVGSEIFAASVSRLSTGEKQRMALVRGFVLQPPVLLLDEPTSALDGESVTRVEDLLRERLDTGLILVLVTHDAGQAGRLGDQRYRMADRRLHAL